MMRLSGQYGHWSELLELNASRAVYIATVPQVDFLWGDQAVFKRSRCE